MDRGPLALFPGCANAIMGSLGARDVYRCGSVNVEWRDVSSTTMERRHESMGNVGAAELCVSSQGERSEIELALVALGERLCWRPQGCLILTTENCGAFGVNSSRRRRRGRNPTVRCLERVAQARLPSDCLIVATTSAGIMGPTREALVELCDLDSNGAAVMLFRSRNRPPALLGLIGRKPVIQYGGSKTAKRKLGYTRQLVDHWLDDHVMSTKDALQLIFCTDAPEAIARAFDGRLFDGHFGRVSGGIVHAVNNSKLLAGVPGDLAHVDLALLTVRANDTTASTVFLASDFMDALNEATPRTSFRRGAGEDEDNDEHEDEEREEEARPSSPVLPRQQARERLGEEGDEVEVELPQKCKESSWGLAVACCNFGNFHGGPNEEDTSNPPPLVTSMFGAPQGTIPNIIGFLAAGELGCVTESHRYQFHGNTNTLATVP